MRLVPLVLCVALAACATPAPVAPTLAEPSSSFWSAHVDSMRPSALPTFPRWLLSDSVTVRVRESLRPSPFAAYRSGAGTLPSVVPFRREGICGLAIPIPIYPPLTGTVDPVPMPEVTSDGPPPVPMPNLCRPAER